MSHAEGSLRCQGSIDVDVGADVDSPHHAIGQAVQPKTWRHLLGAAYAAPDGRTFLIEVLKHLADENRASGAPRPVSDQQLRWALEQLADESTS